MLQLNVTVPETVLPAAGLVIVTGAGVGVAVGDGDGLGEGVGVGDGLHLPEVTALNSAWISLALSARLKISTSSIAPFIKALWETLEPISKSVELVSVNDVPGELVFSSCPFT